MTPELPTHELPIPELLTAHAVASRLGLSPYRVYALIRAGKLPAVHTGLRSVHIPRVAFENYLHGLNTAALASIQPKPIALADLLAFFSPSPLPIPADAKTAGEVFAALGSAFLSMAALPAAEDKSEEAGKHMSEYLKAHFRR